MPMSLIDSTGKPMPMSTEKTQKEIISEFFNTLGITYSVRFIPQSRSRNKDGEPCLNWIVTFSRGVNWELQTDYMQGIGHLKNYSHKEYKLVWYNNCIKHACESGKWNPNLKFETQNPIHPAWKHIPKPDVVDILYCLVSDYSVLNYPTYESWARDYGYDEDSRKGEKVYNECMKLALQKRSIFGEDTLRKLQELYQDY